jgi:aminoglycoside 6'-N-acetyltransferase
MALSDLAAFMAYRSDPQLGRYQGWTPMDDAGSRAFIEKMAGTGELSGGEWLQVSIADAVTSAMLGDIGIHPDPDFAGTEIGFTLAAAHHGRGLAAEAVGALVEGLFRDTPTGYVRGVTDARNTPSIALLERLGFRRSAEQRTVFRGEPCREYVYVFERPVTSAGRQG